MCGFFCAISANQIDLELSSESLNLITHRGPDSQKYFLNNKQNIFLGFNRLSILDLSSKADQPMTDKRTKRIIVFNGEIYNHFKIRNFLKTKNYVFETKSDTEVILNAYDYWKDDFPNHIEGMFSIVIYDPNICKIFFIRDRAGEKPLYYYRSKHNFYLSSEIKPICNYSNNKKISKDSINNYFEKGYAPKDKSMLEGINKLKAGHKAELDLNSFDLKISRYWNLDKDITKFQVIKNDTNYYVDKFEKLLTESVKNQLIADVPIGLMLSGGVDSSLIVATASKYFDSLNTFTVTFPQIKKYDESKHAQLIAKKFKTNHMELRADKVEPNIFYELAKYYDEPMVDSSMIPTFLLCKEIKKYCKVALGGDGADELFGGYSHYNRYNSLSRLQKFLPNPIRSSLVNLALYLLPKNIKGRKSLDLFGKDIANLNFDTANLFDFAMRKKLFNDQSKLTKTIKDKKVISTDLIRSITYEDYNNYLSEDILVKVDRASMASSLEVRSPFLDSKITEFAFLEVPSHLKLYKNQRKILPKLLAKRILPKEFDYKRKQGFSFPVNELFQSGPWHDFLREKVNSSNNLYLNKVYCSELLDRQAKGDNLGESLFAIALFLVWCEIYVN